MERSLESDLTIILRSGRRHVFKYSRNLNQSWNSLVGSLSEIVLGESSTRWGLLIATHNDHYLRALPGDNAMDTLRRSGLGALQCGRVEIFMVLPDDGGVFPETPCDSAPLLFELSDCPVRLPKGLVDFIDHLRPASQVS